ncbi:ectoine/hydroxyectoine ABC transporter permease subunit EhuC [Paenalcaligenes faecalis]|uniref:ectoine/hydroxyectoine ABC transporter permease subunit EhuC n=1 Tax=Paenalcaligenes faecalis TaxID=2980099 RepID=UPI0022B9D33E|nr:ectoine/hydroxyectoine ABC transporter permease subunit EhuC [Paenalcaligenes faecalis]
MTWIDYSGPLLAGAWVTVQLTIYSTILGAVFAFLFGVGRLSTSWWIKSTSICFIEIFRGTSLLVQLFWLYFALPMLGQLIGLDLRLPPVVAGTLALALNIGAYGAEVVRGAIQAVPPTQYEAAKALDFSPRQTMWRIAVPQAIPEMMPSFGNLAVQNLKDTALVSLIGLADLAFRAEQIRNYTQDSTTIYTMLLFMYFGMALVISGLMRVLERYTTRWRAGGQ